jgi:hypothetical protein
VLGLLILAGVIPWYLQSSPPVVARQYLTELGVPTDNLDLVAFRRLTLIPGVLEDATVTFRVKGADPPKKLEVELSRPLFFLPWHGSAFREVKDK